MIACTFLRHGRRGAPPDKPKTPPAAQGRKKKRKD